MNAHAMLTEAGDLREYEAFMRSFGENSKVRLSKSRIIIAIFWLSSGH